MTNIVQDEIRPYQIPFRFQTWIPVVKYFGWALRKQHPEVATKKTEKGLAFITPTHPDSSPESKSG